MKKDHDGQTLKRASGGTLLLVQVASCRGTIETTDRILEERRDGVLSARRLM